MPCILLLLAGAAAAACATGRGSDDPPPGARAATTIYVAGSGWHADLIVPRAAIPAGLWPEAADFPGARYLRVGWGERDYYPSTEFSIWYGLKALFWPTASVLHVVGFSRPPAIQYPQDEIVALELSRDGMHALMRYIDTAHARGGAVRAPRLVASPYGDGWFYPAERAFHLFRTCNVWTAEALRAAGLPLRAAFALTTESVMSQVRPLGRQVQQGVAAAAGCALGQVQAPARREAIANSTHAAMKAVPPMGATAPQPRPAPSASAYRLPQNRTIPASMRPPAHRSSVPGRRAATVPSASRPSAWNMWYWTAVWNHAA